MSWNENINGEFQTRNATDVDPWELETTSRPIYGASIVSGSTDHVTQGKCSRWAITELIVLHRVRLILCFCSPLQPQHAMPPANQPYGLAQIRFLNKEIAHENVWTHTTHRGNLVHTSRINHDWNFMPSTELRIVFYSPRPVNVVSKSVCLREVPSREFRRLLNCHYYKMVTDQSSGR